MIIGVAKQGRKTVTLVKIGAIEILPRRTHSIWLDNITRITKKASVIITTVATLKKGIWKHFGVL